MSGLLKEQLINAIPTLSEDENPHVTAFTCERDDLVQTVMDLANKCGYVALLDLSVVEYPDDMVGVYNLMNLEDMDTLCLSVHFSKDELWLPSLNDVFKAAYVLEREMYDLFGVEYKGHPDLRRIFLPDDFVGHPLRKDYENHIRK